MDVKCEKCGTEYEFDDAKVSESGITVKCTHCGHLFRVAREASGSSSSVEVKRATPPPRPNHWMIRNEDGEIREFKDLATLQQWIIERKVSRQDEISKTGDSWKPLGSIIELSSFFIAVDGGARPEAASTTRPSRRASVMTPSQAPAPPPPQGSDDLLDTGEFSLEGPGRRARDELAGIDTPARFPVMPGPVSTPTSTSQRLEGSRLTPEPSLPKVSVQRTPPPTFADRYTPAPYDPEPRRDGSTRGFVIGVLVTLLLASGAYFLYQRLAQTGEPDAEALLQLERAERSAEQDTEEGRAQAEASYAGLLESAGATPADKDLATRAHVGIARIASARAEYARLEGKDGRDALDRAERALANARSLSQDNPEVLLAYADFYRVMGVPDSARRYLRLAKQGGANSAELAFEEAGMGMHAKRPNFAKVADRLGKLPAEARDLPRARYLHAVALERSGRKDQAIKVLVELLSKNRQHEAGSSLLQVLNAGGTVVAALPAAEPDTGAGAAAEAEKRAEAERLEAGESARAAVAAKLKATAAEEAAAADAKAEAAKADAASAAAKAKASAAKAAAAGSKPAASGSNSTPRGSYDVVMKSGYKLLEAGKTQSAIRQFRRAIDMRPQSSEAWANLAWCELDLGHPSKAVRYFGRALESNARYADAMYGRAVAYERSNQKSRAVDAYKRYLEVHGSSRKAETVRRRLERLK